MLDGAGDYASLKGGVADFADSGTFGISFWMTKPACNIPGR